MNRRLQGLSLSKALLGFEQYKTAEGLSPTTISSYRDTLKQWLERVGDVDVASITTQDLRAYLAWLRTEYVPKRKNGDTHPLSAKTIRNVWATFSSFFTWATTEFSMPNPMDGIPGPKFERKPVNPLTKEEVEALLKACDFCREADTVDRRKFTMRRKTARRDRAIILTLLDTGLRASEICSLKVGDVDQRTGRIDVRHGPRGGAKGNKGRVVFLGKAARRMVWRYLAEREDGEDADAPLFTARYDRPMSRTGLRLVIKSLADKAGVEDCYPHKFRHTFAITYLRAGGDVFTLQALLGHSTLEMVRYYSQVAEIDLQRAHRKASPADSWRL